MVESVQRRVPIGIEMAENPTKELSLIFRYNTGIDIIDGALVGSRNTEAIWRSRSYY
jgi:hypothetical protein